MMAEEGSTIPMNETEIRRAVDDRYRRLAVEGKRVERPEDDERVIRIYSPDELESVPEGVAESSCACGNPVAIASLRKGEVVLDLGSGSGMDVFLAARRVGPTGRVIGVDRTDEMLDKARSAAEAQGLSGVEFRKGEIESLPVEDDSVDIVISNCVINLVTDKDAVFREAFRVLRPGGRLAISDRVLKKELPAGARGDLDLWSACVSGALLEEDYLARIERAGFVGVEVESSSTYSRKDLEGIVTSVARRKREEGGEFDEETVIQSYLAVASDRIVAWKPPR